MIALALEFSSDRRSVAVGRAGELLAEVTHLGTVNTPVFALIAEALRQASVEREDVGQLVVGVGPGSYTGVRIAISAAQGWQLATGATCVGVNSLENLARSVTDRILLAVDAQRGEFASAWAEAGRLLEPIRLRSKDELLGRLGQGEWVGGPDLERLLPGARPLFPTALGALALAVNAEAVPAETLAPSYLREASFVKAPPTREIAGLQP
jgi:tRNA threonylcarbamoyl adenosine modification protein YeaZ